jgi:hypothetical protein
MAVYQFDMTAANAALKELYTDQVVQNLVYADNPFLAMVPKVTDFGGKYKPIPIIIGTSQGRSATFSIAPGYQSPPIVNSFLLTRMSDYSIASIDNQTMLAAKTDKMAFIEGAKLVVDSAIRVITNSLATSLYRSGTGTIGRISDITSGVITLSSAADVVNFEVNQAIQVTSTDGGTPRTTVGYVCAVNRSAGTLSVSTAYGVTTGFGTPTNWTNNDYILTYGDLVTTGTQLKVSGLAAWIPTSAPGTTAFYGVNRATDTIRLGGVRYDGSTQTIEEALIDATALVAREGGRPNKVFMSYGSFAAFVKSLGSKVQYIDVKGPAEVGFRGVRIIGSNTQLDCFPDRSCPANLAYALQMDTWQLASLGDAPQILRYGDGLEMLRIYNADASEIRCGYYANLACNAPGWNCVVQLSA